MIKGRRGYGNNTRGGTSRKIEGVCGTLPETLTLFQTKICGFPYPISYLIKNLIHHFEPDPKTNTLFQTCLIISSLGQTSVEGNVYALLLSRIQN